jgi:hypothetical protein
MTGLAGSTGQNRPERNVPPSLLGHRGVSTQNSPPSGSPRTKSLLISSQAVQYPSEGQDGVAWDIYLRMADQEWLTVLNGGGYGHC